MSPLTRMTPTEAIARACAEDDGQTWDELPAEQQASDRDQASWMITIIAAAGYTLVEAHIAQTMPEPHRAPGADEEPAT